MSGRSWSLIKYQYRLENYSWPTCMKGTKMAAWDVSVLGHIPTFPTNLPKAPFPKAPLLQAPSGKAPWTKPSCKTTLIHTWGLVVIHPDRIISRHLTSTMIMLRCTMPSPPMNKTWLFPTKLTQPGVTQCSPMCPHCSRSGTSSMRGQTNTRSSCSINAFSISVSSR